MTYSEKLKDPRWAKFRALYFIDYERREGPFKEIVRCETCGCDAGNWHLHHKRYDKDREPWEYSFQDVALICKECHDEIHECERNVRAWIIAQKSEAIYEFNAFMKQLMRLERPSHGAAWARNALYELAERRAKQDGR